MSRRATSRSASRRSRGPQALIVGGPHAVEAALRGPHEVERVFADRDAAGTRVDDLLAMAKRAGIPISRAEGGECDRLCGTRAQGVAACLRFSYASFEGLLTARSGLILFLDGIEDPHNLGAVIRTAEAAGALGVVVPGRRTAAVTAAVVRASAGAALYLPVARPSNLATALRAAREAGYWLIGLDHRAERLLEPQPEDGRTGLVVGGEARGIGRLVGETCDELARLPMRGRVESLNASVAAALAIYRVCGPALFGPSAD